MVALTDSIAVTTASQKRNVIQEVQSSVSQPETGVETGMRSRRAVFLRICTRRRLVTSSTESNQCRVNLLRSFVDVVSIEQLLVYAEQF
jgi:hypothetical protein